jgi:hypothetical protein
MAAIDQRLNFPEAERLQEIFRAGLIFSLVLIPLFFFGGSYQCAFSLK